MWHSRMYNSEMDSPLPQAQQRPWTPPETDVDDDTSPHSDYFSDPFRPSPAFSADLQHRWSSHPDAMSEKMGVRCDTPTEAQNPRPRPKPANRATEPAPYTPVKHLNYGVQHAHGALRYPYTPDSSRVLRRHNTDIPSSPMPWDDFSEPESSSSPVQDALSSCIAQFENLIHSQQPDEEQMEYIVAQFEAMTSFLSAPDAQSKKTDEHLFNEPELGSLGLGVLNDGEHDRAARVENMSAQANDAYVAEVGAYIDSVKKYIEDLKMRLDEVKTLNSIQLDVIHDLRRQMRSVRQGMRTSLDMRDEMAGVETELDKIAALDESTPSPAAPEAEKKREFGIDSWETLVDDSEHAQPAVEKAEASSSSVPASSAKPRKSVQFDNTPRYKVIHIVRKPERRSFWSSFGEALDSFGALLRDDE